MITLGRHTSRNALIAVIFIGIVGYIAFTNPDLFTGEVTGIPIIGDGSVDNVMDVQLYQGDITQTVAFFDTSVSTTAYGDDTETDTVFYKCIAGSCTGNDDFIFLAASTNAAPAVATLPITTDIETVYMEIGIQTGNAFYLDPVKTTNTNSRVGNPLWLDLDSNNRNTWVFPVDVTGYNPDPNTTPTQTVNVAVVAEGSITVDSPADIGNLGTGKARCNIKWSLDMSGTAGLGEVVNRVRITMNSTDTSEWYPLDSSLSWPTGSLPNSGTTKIFLNEFDDIQLASTFQYQWDIGDGDVDEGKLLITENNGETNFETPFELFTNMADAGGIGVTLLVQTINAQGLVTTVNDVVNCVENPP